MIKYPTSMRRTKGETFFQQAYRIYWSAPVFFFFLFNLAFLLCMFFYLYPHAGEQKLHQVKAKIIDRQDKERLALFKKLSNGTVCEVNDYLGMITYRITPVSSAFNNPNLMYEGESEILQGSREHAVLRLSDDSVYCWKNGDTEWKPVTNLTGFHDLEFVGQPLIYEESSTIRLAGRDSTGRAIFLEFNKESSQPHVLYLRGTPDEHPIRTIQDRHIISRTEDWFSDDVLATRLYSDPADVAKDSSGRQVITWRKGKTVIDVTTDEDEQLQYIVTDSAHPKEIEVYTLHQDVEDGFFYWRISETWKIDMRAYQDDVESFSDDHTYYDGRFYTPVVLNEKLEAINILNDRDNGTYSTSSFVFDPKTRFDVSDNYIMRMIQDSVIWFRDVNDEGFYLIRLGEDQRARVLNHFMQDDFYFYSSTAHDERNFYILSHADNKFTLITIDLITGKKQVIDLPAGEYNSMQMSVTPAGLRFVGVIGDGLAINSFGLDENGKAQNEQLVYIGTWPVNPFNIEVRYNPAPMIILPIIYLTFFIIMLIQIRDHKARLEARRDLEVIKRIPSLEARFLELQALTTNLKRRSEIMLMLGIFFALFGVGVFSLLLTGMKEELALANGNWEQIIIFSKPTVLLIFIETFSFFFLRQYRVIFNEYKDFYLQYQRMQKYFHLLEVTDGVQGATTTQQQQLLELIQKEDVAFGQVNTDNQLFGSEFKDILSELRGISEKLGK
jgi:hypothetical protein